MFCWLVIWILFSSCAISAEFFVVYVNGSCISWLSFLLRCSANLYDGVYILLMTGLMGRYVLCVLIRAVRFGALGFIYVRYLFWFLFIKMLDLCMVFWICLWNAFVGSSFYCIWFSCMKLSIFCFNVSLCVITKVIPSSAFADVLCPN
jgi:hypothetical protein